MKKNASLAGFTNAIAALIVVGLVLALVGIFVVSSAEGNLTAAVNGIGLLYVGSGLVGLGIFGAFLRITATSIVEGLGGNIAISESYIPSVNNSPSAQLNDSGETKASKTSVLAGPSDAWQHLSGKEYRAWQAEGMPDLRAWDEAGRPDFMTWLKNR